MIEIEWGNAERNIICWKFIQPWTWNEAYDAQDQVIGMIESVTGTVDVIFVASRTQLLPPNATLHLRRFIERRHKRHDLIIVVGANRFLYTLLNVMKHWIPGFARQLYYANSQAEAYSIIEKAQQKRQQAAQNRLSNLPAAD